MHSLNVLHAAMSGPAGIFIPDTFAFRADGTVSHVLRYNANTQKIDTMTWPVDGEDADERRSEQRRRVLDHLLRNYDEQSDVVAILQKPLKQKNNNSPAGKDESTARPASVDYLDSVRLTQFLSLQGRDGDQSCLLSQFVHPKEDVLSLVYCVYQGTRVVATEWRVCKNALSDLSLPVRERTCTTAAPVTTATGEKRVLSQTRPMFPGSEKRLQAICRSIADGFDKLWNPTSSRLALYFIPTCNPGLPGVAKYYLLSASEAPSGHVPVPSGICDEDVSWTREAQSAPPQEISVSEGRTHAMPNDPHHWTFTRLHAKHISPSRSDAEAARHRRPSPSLSRARSDREVAEEDGRVPWQSYQRGRFDMPQVRQPSREEKSKKRDQQVEDIPCLTMEDYVLGLRNGSMTGYLVAPPFLGSTLDCGVPISEIGTEIEVLCGGGKKPRRQVSIGGLDRSQASEPVELAKKCDSTRILREYEDVLKESSKVMFSEAKEWEARRLHTSLIPQDDDEFGELRRNMEPFVPAVRRSFLEKLFAERTRPPVEEVCELNKSEMAQSIRKKEISQLAAILQRYGDSPSQGGIVSQMSMSGGVLSPIRAEQQTHDYNAGSLLGLVELLYTKVQDMLYEIYAKETAAPSGGSGASSEPHHPRFAVQMIRDLQQVEADEVKEWLAINNVSASVQTPTAAAAKPTAAPTVAPQRELLGDSVSFSTDDDQPPVLVDVAVNVPAKYAAAALLKSRFERQFELFRAFANTLTTAEEQRAFRRAVRSTSSKSAIRAVAIACELVDGADKM